MRSHVTNQINLLIQNVICAGKRPAVLEKLLIVILLDSNL